MSIVERSSYIVIVVAASIAALVGRPVASAQPVPDHLECYKVKDAQPKAAYTADLGGLTAHPGCVVKVPGTLLCVESTKTNVTPPPPGGTDDSAPAGRFLCYKVKCPKTVLAPVQWQDQFGTRSLAPTVAKMLCAPEIVTSTTSTTAAPATSSTDAPTSSTTSIDLPTSTTTTTMPVVCAPGTSDCDGVAGNGCECAGNICCGGACEPPHTNGLGQSFDDCTPLGAPGDETTYTPLMATEARAAWPFAGTDSTGICGGATGPTCAVRTTPTSCAVWCYTKSLAGYVHLNTANNTCDCPTTADAQWQ